ncbi:MAG TPA: hypothetical protein VFS84_12440, partial [Candidatus Binatia bacterium]|nr:hypothetical protein [Candidatus Binatia bacterium]
EQFVWRHDQSKSLDSKTLPHRMTAFLFMAKQTVIAETHAAERAIELLTMKNFVPAFAAFDSSIDQLKHPMFIPTVLVINTSAAGRR